MSRRSRWPLSDPGPSKIELDTIFDVALRAPDNGLLRPWRFVVIQGDARDAFGDLLVDISSAREPDWLQTEHAQRKQRAFAAPLIIALGASVIKRSPIPEVEQLLSVGAAVMNMLNAVHALGYGGYWTSGPDCYEPELQEALGLKDEDRLLGFLYIGTPCGALPDRERPLKSSHVREWGVPYES